MPSGAEDSVYWGGPGGGPGGVDVVVGEGVGAMQRR